MLISAKIYLSYYASTPLLEERIEQLRAGEPGRIGLVSSALPLISNLSLKQNCALILQYHRRYSTRDALAEADRLLTLFGLQAQGELDYSRLHEIDLFIGKLIRASLLEQAVVVIDRPSAQLHANFDIDDIVVMINKLADHFRSCHILEYQWEQDRHHGLRRVF